jgi:starvation-inducible DNA-binding protein
MDRVTTELQKLLAGTQIFLMNARAYHWNLTGISFFFLHEQFGNLYNGLSSDADIIAERIRARNDIPIHKYSEYLKLSAIKETNVTETQAMIKETVSSLLATLKQLYVVQKIAVTTGDEGTNQMVGDMILQTEKRLWMYRSCINSSFNVQKLAEKLTQKT